MKKLLLFAAVLFTANLSQAQWQPDVRLTNSSGESWTAFNNAWGIATNENVIHVVWYDIRDGNYEIYYKRSVDGGTSWGVDTRLTFEAAMSWLPSIAVFESVVHIVWEEHRDGNGEIYYKCSTDGGISWGADTRLTNNNAGSILPSLAISGPVLHLAWQDERDSNNGEIYYKRSTDGGATWSDDVRLTFDSEYSGIPSIVVSDQAVHVVWEDMRNGDSEIFYKRSSDGGTSWGSDTRLTNNSAGSWDPSIAVSGSVVHVTWQDNRDGGGYEIYYKRSTDGGLTWGADARLTNAPGDSDYPNMAVSGPVIHAAWQDKRVGNQEIYYKKSIDGGVTWGADVRLTNAYNISAYPSLCIAGSQVNVVWCDLRDGNYEVYYKRDPTGGALVADFNANSTTVCQGDTVQFTDLTSCNPNQWQWTFEGGSPGTSTLQNPEIAYETPGSYDVTLFVSNGTSDDQITKTDYISVFPISLSAPITPEGPDQLCQNSSNTQYSTSESPGATQYQWQLTPVDAGTIIALGTMGTVNWAGDFTGEAELTVKALNACIESEYSPPLVISVLPLPISFTVTGGGPYCFGTAGSTVGLSGSQINHTYELYLDDQPTGTTLQGSGSVISFPGMTAPGIYTMMATENSTLCSSLMDGVVEVSIVYLPESPPVSQGPVYVDLGYIIETEYNTEGSSGSASYEWMLDPSEAGIISIPNLTTAQVSWALDFLGVANLSVRGVNDCGPGEWSEPLAITVINTVGMIDSESPIVTSIFPNPNLGTFHIKLSDNQDETVTLRLFNTMGEVIFEKKEVIISGLNQESIIIEVKSGVYYLQIENQSGVSMHKIIVKDK